MLTPFFVQAALSPGRQQTFRRLVGAHLAVLAAAAWAMRFAREFPPGVLLGHVQEFWIALCDDRE